MKDNLDDIKKTWQSISEAKSQKEYSVQEIKKIINKRSKNELSKIRRKLIAEFCISFILALGLFIYFYNMAHTKYAIILVLIFSASLLPHIIIIVRSEKINQSDLKSYLSSFITLFNSMVEQYVRMSVFLLPLSGFIGFMLGSQVSSKGNFQWEDFFSFSNLGFIALLLIPLSIAGFFAIRSYFKWIYGKNIKRLSDCLSDLEEVENF